MILSLSEISTVDATFAEDVDAYAAAGFDAIGLWEFKLPADDEANIALLREHGLRVAVCVPAVPSVLPLAIAGMEGPQDVDERIRALEASVRRFAAYEPECVACLPGPLGGRTEAEGTDLVVDALRRMAAAGGGAGVRVGFESVHASQREEAGFVNSLAHADALLERVGAPEIGILFDTYHLWDDPGVLDWIRREQQPRRRRPRERLAVPRSQRPRPSGRGDLAHRRARRGARRRGLGRRPRRRGLLHARALLGPSRRRGRAPSPRGRVDAAPMSPAVRRCRTAAG